MKPNVVRIGHELALPFVRTYCTKWNLRVDNLDCAERIWWWGAVNENAIRAVMGIEPTTPSSMYVWGWFGDGSGTIGERRCLQRIIQVLDELPFDLEGTILLDNAPAQRYAARHGWDFGNLCTIDGVHAVKIRKNHDKLPEAAYG